MHVHWDKDICKHAGICVSSLPQVFTVKEGSLAIDTSKAEPEVIRSVVARCPSGALTVQEPEQPNQ